MLPRPLAAAYARVALANILRPFPHKLDHVLAAAAHAPLTPAALHPAFYGSYDWHSAVHMHWLLARILRLHPDLDAAPAIAAAFNNHLSREAIAAEEAYLARPEAATFERPYGWAWLLALHAELVALSGVHARGPAWRDAVAPLAALIASRLRALVDTAPYPIRAGTHGNTAFACLLVLAAARARGGPTAPLGPGPQGPGPGDAAGTPPSPPDASGEPLIPAIHAAAVRWYGKDRAAEPAFEPSLTDFLSPILCEAALMAEVLAPAAFAEWFAELLPAGLGPLAEPPIVSDRADPQVVHLDGLCLSRGWCLRRIATRLEALPAAARSATSPLTRAGLAPAILRVAAEANLAAGLPQCTGGDYVGEHWLASFAVLALSEPGPAARA